MQDHRKMVILADGMLDFHHGKTATSILRYRPDDVVAIVDSQHAGSDSEDVLGIGGRTPVVRDISEAFQYEPTELLIGVATRGGYLPAEGRQPVVLGLQHGLA